MKSLANVVSYFALGACLFGVQLWVLGTSLDRFPLMFMSHTLLVGVVLFHLGMNMFGARPSFTDASIVVFEITFLIIAPILQLAHDTKNLVSTKPWDDASAMQSNLIYIAFIISYLVVRHLSPRPIAQEESLSSANLRINYVALFPVLAICAVGAISALNFAQDVQAGDLDDMEITPLDMIRAKVLYFLIVPVFMFIVLYRPRRIGPVWIALVLSSFVLLCLCENPLTEKRNALGPIYLTLLALVFRRWLRSPPRVFWSIFFLSGLFFPIAELFTNYRIADWPVAPAVIEDFFEQHFTSTTYDAWANTDAVIEIVSREGIYWGKQLSGALLFFVPHTLWPEKPLGTGILIGDYLLRNYSMWFVNLSAPLPAEGYLDFGWGGVVLYGALLGYFSRRVDALLDSAVPIWRALGFYLSFYTVFLLRGSLMVAVAYAVPVLVTFAFVSVVLTSRANGRLAQRTI
ncbi:hypothetical protein CBA19CS11_31840 [Caballeronia novacaledonica]|jgi:hypothetical protein|uniref:hypothetical protein n=1 Tax=Caballeronia novacaledonica TaxID=1544861 RepID=UPI001EE2FA4A|nr:hypothetical protein [Caballeronia novacaledonica]GJH13528.1 hypothetical protein CBA19CS11_31840 [Caballeronia novacaledonica]